MTPLKPEHADNATNFFVANRISGGDFSAVPRKPTLLARKAKSALADLIGPRATLTLGGLCCVAAALFLARNRHRLREQIRPIYERLGIGRRFVNFLVPYP